MKCKLDAFFSKFFIIFVHISREILHHYLPTWMAVLLLEQFVVQSGRNKDKVSCFSRNRLSGDHLLNNGHDVVVSK